MSASKATPVDASDDLDDLDDILDEFNDAKKPAAAPAPATSNKAGDADSQAPASSSTGAAQLPSMGAVSAGVDGSETEEELNERFARELAVGMEALMKGLGPEAGEEKGAGEMSNSEPKPNDESGENLFNEEEMMKQFEQMMADMGLGGLGGLEGLTGAGEAPGGMAPAPSSSSPSQAGPAAPPANFQDAIKSTMSRLRESDASASSSTGGAGDGLDLEKLMAALGNGEGPEGEEGIAKMLESMMGELMSRDVLYEPLKELKEKVRVVCPPSLLPHRLTCAPTVPWILGQPANRVVQRGSSSLRVAVSDRQPSRRHL